MEPVEPAPDGRPPGFWKTIGFLYAVCIIEGADQQLLPATFRALERSLGLSPVDLATLGLAQAMTQCCSAPFWGNLADHGVVTRKALLQGGAFSWGLLTLLLAMVSNFHSMIVLRALNGIALGTLMPVSQSLVADMTQPSERGAFFGGFQFALNVSIMISAVGATSVSNEIIWGYEGWRVAFAAVAIASFILAIALAWGMTEPEQRSEQGEALSFTVAMSKIRSYWRIGSFRVIVLQGAFGSIPWSALSFLILYFQCRGISDTDAAILYVSQVVGGAAGGILGGWVGDRLSEWSPNHGRPLTAQISVISGIPLITTILSIVPDQPARWFATYFWLMFVFGLCASWCAVGVNRPILTEIVGDRDRASILSWVVAMDGAFAALLGGPVVGMLAESVFGYRSSKESISEMPIQQRNTNATALSHAMLCCTIVPWIICFIFYSFLHRTYGPDVAASKCIDKNVVIVEPVEGKEGNVRQRSSSSTASTPLI